MRDLQTEDQSVLEHVDVGGVGLGGERVLLRETFGYLEVERGL